MKIQYFLSDGLSFSYSFNFIFQTLQEIEKSQKVFFKCSCSSESLSLLRVTRFTETHMALICKPIYFYFVSHKFDADLQPYVCSEDFLSYSVSFVQEGTDQKSTSSQLRTLKFQDYVYQKAQVCAQTINE